MKSINPVKEGRLKMMALNTFMKTLITKKTSVGMYGYYAKTPSPSGYNSIYLQECLLLMLRFPEIQENLGLSLMDLLHLPPSDITTIENNMVDLHKKKKNVRSPSHTGIKDTEYAREMLRYTLSRKKKP